MILCVISDQFGMEPVLSIISFSKINIKGWKVATWYNHMVVDLTDVDIEP